MTMRDSANWDLAFCLGNVALATLELQNLASEGGTAQLAFVALSVQVACLMLVRARARIVSMRPSTLLIVAIGVMYPFLYEPVESGGWPVLGELLVFSG